MADRTVRAIFEARTQRAQKNVADFGKTTQETGKKVDGLTDDLKALDGQKVEPEIDVKIGEAKKRLTDLTADLADLKAMEASPEVDLRIEETKAQIKDVRAEIKDLTSQKYEVRVDAAIKDAKARVEEITRELGDLRTLEVTPEVEVEIREAQRRLTSAKREVRELNAAKATVRVDADTRAATSALDGVADDAADAGTEGGDAAGENMVSGILGSLKSIPVAGAVIGVGVAIGVGLFKGIQDGLQIEAGRDLFSARTGFDAETSARFGRAAGEAYSQAWGESVEANMETARVALEQGLIDEDAVDAEIEGVIASLSGVADIMQEDIPAAARAAGQMVKTGLADTAEEAFDVLVAGYQNGASASDDLLDTFGEYSVLFERLGLDAVDATGLLIQGLEGGAFNADKTADALKEFQIRATDASETSAEGFRALGLDAEEMTAKIAKGGDDAREGLGQVLEGLREIEDPVKRNAAGVALFGTQWEDMGDAINNLDLSSAADELGGLEGASGAAGRALETMADNASTDIESAKRNIETAMDGIKGALAAAFSDDISGAADWVASNREALMQFFLDVVNGALDAGDAFVQFGATVMEALAEVMEGAADILVWLPGFSPQDREDMKKSAQGIRDAADTMRTEWGGALEETQEKVNEWAAPELMKARIHDAQMAMSADMDTFSAKVDKSGGTVKINGNKVNAEQALDILVSNINAEDGTVTINGERVPAERALAVLMGHVNSSKGSVTIGGRDNPARGTVAGLMGYVGSRKASVSVGANTWQAERDINYAARDRYTTLNVRVAGENSIGGIPLHDGGRVPGLHGGGRVPGQNASQDNILWPLHSGGQTLHQPLTGTEWVINPTASALWDPLLGAINNGMKPGDLQGGGQATIDYDRLAKALARHVGPAVQQGAYAGTAQQRSNEYARASTTPRGRTR